MIKIKVSHLDILRFLILGLFIFQAANYYGNTKSSLASFILIGILLMLIDCSISYYKVRSNKIKHIKFFRRIKKRTSVLLIVNSIMAFISVYYLFLSGSELQSETYLKPSLSFLLFNSIHTFYEHYLKSKREYFGIGIDKDTIHVYSADNTQEFVIPSIYSARVKPNNIVYMKDSPLNDINIRISEYESPNELLLTLSDNLKNIKGFAN